MEVIKGIIKDHYKKYPKMELQDFIKMFYQNSFGPKHIQSNPSLESTIQFIEEELGYFVENSETRQVEYIGNDYYRVSLSVIKHGLLSPYQLGQAFYQSMLESPIIEDYNIQLFINQLRLLCEMINENILQLDKEKCQLMVEEYLDKGIRPIHHSDTYKELYHPHYRLVHKTILRNYLEI
ncbi:MAG: hypothetical protein AB7E09_05475 [Candidatus Izemoplasmatales bacterium]